MAIANRKAKSWQVPYYVWTSGLTTVGVIDELSLIFTINIKGGLLYKSVSFLANNVNL